MSENQNNEQQQQESSLIPKSIIKAKVTTDRNGKRQFSLKETKTKPLDIKEAMLGANYLIALGALNNMLPSIQDCSFYKNGIKLHSKQLRKEMETVLKNEGLHLMETDEDTFCNLIELYEELLTDMFSISADYWRIVPYILKWIKDPNGLCFLQLKAMVVQQDSIDANNNKK